MRRRVAAVAIVTAELVKRAEALGYKALFITVDSAGVSKNESDLRLTPGTTSAPQIRPARSMNS